MFMRIASTLHLFIEVNISFKISITLELSDLLCCSSKCNGETLGFERSIYFV